MWKVKNNWLAAALLLGSVASVQAQSITPLPVFAPGVNPTAPFYNRVNPFYRVAPFTTQQQALYNFAQTNRAIRTAPPWVYGYNPYPQVMNRGPIIQPITPNYPFNPLTWQGGNVYSPTNAAPGTGMLDPSNPYSTASSVGDPYSSAASAYSNYYNPYGYGSMYGPVGGALMGAASLTTSQGQLMVNREMAYILREKAEQEKLKTKKEALDTANYLREHAWTYTKEQDAIARRTLDLIRANATPALIESGRAANILLADLGKQRGKTANLPPLPLEENELRLLNVGNAKGGNLGLLRNEGRFTWPLAMAELLSKEKRRALEILTQDVVQQAANGNINPNQLRDLNGAVEQMRDQLATRINEFGTADVIEGKKFINDLSSAVQALREPNSVAEYFRYQKFVQGGKTVQEVVDYLNTRGLSLLPALPGDQAAYNAFFNALASYNVAFNAQVVSK